MQPHFKKARLSTNVNGQMSNPMLMGGMMGQGMLPMMTMNPMASMMGANPMLASMMQASMNHHPGNPGQFHHSGVLEEVHEDNDDGANEVVEDALAATEEEESGPGPSDPAMGPMGSVRTKAPPSKPVCPSLQPNQSSKPNVSQGFALSIVGDTIEEAVAGVMQARRTLFQAQKDSMPIPRCVKYLGGLPKARHSIHQPYCDGFVESERSV